MVHSELVKQIDRWSQWPADHPRPDRFVALTTFLDRTLIVTILIFGLAVAHSIAAAQIAYLSGVLCWLGRQLFAGFPRRESGMAAARRRSPLLLPLLCFALLTILSAIFSYAPEISLLKSKALGLFLVFFLIRHNLTRRGAIVFTCLLFVSSLIGVGYSLTEKLVGRGMVIEFIDRQSPLAGSGLQPGDVIWMIARRRVGSPEEMREVIAGHRVGERLSVEALHAGDPVPVELTVTESLRLSAAALGIRGGAPSRFRGLLGAARS